MTKIAIVISAGGKAYVASHAGRARAMVQLFQTAAWIESPTRQGQSRAKTLSKANTSDGAVASSSVMVQGHWELRAFRVFRAMINPNHDNCIACRLRRAPRSNGTGCQSIGIQDL